MPSGPTWMARDIPEYAMLVAADGKKIHIHGTVAPMKDENSQFNGMVLMFAPLEKQNVLHFLDK